MSVTTFGAAGSAALLPPSITIEQAKRKVAYSVVAPTTSTLRCSSLVPVLEAQSFKVLRLSRTVLAKNLPKNGRYIFFVPTGFQSEKVIEQAGLPMPMGFDSLNVMLDVAFDGAGRG